VIPSPFCLHNIQQGTKDMAWEAISAEDVSALSGISEDRLIDLWYDMAIGILSYVCEVNNIGDLTSVTETIDGTGSSSVSVKSPPITSVTSVSVDGSVVESSKYTHDKRNIVLVDSFTTNPYSNHDVFPTGVRNVSVTYVSGQADDHVYGLAIALIVKEIASLKIGEAADARIQFGSTTRSDGKTLSRKYIGVHTRVVEIANTLFRKKIRVR